MGSRILYCLGAMLLATELAAATITVERDGTGDFMVLQEALNAASDGDTIRLGTGDFTEMPWTRLPDWTWDIRSCARIQVDDVTIIGVGPGLTRIGPTAFSANFSLFSPVAILYQGQGGLRLQDLAVRNCYIGVQLKGTLEMNNCLIDDHAIGVWWDIVASGGGIRDTTFRGASSLTPIGLRIWENHGGGSGIMIERCELVGVSASANVAEIMFIDCSFRESRLCYQSSSIGNSIFHRCSLDAIWYALSIQGGRCEIHDSDISGGKVALDLGGNVANGRFVVQNSRLQGGDIAVLNARYRPGPCVITGSDLIKGAGPVVQCSQSYTTVTHDLRNNYWGTTSEADIQSWIIDHNDDPNIPATVLYLPFVGMPVPTESTSWGDLKASFR